MPQGHGHYIENTGEDELQVVLVLNNATYQSIFITAWMAGTARPLACYQFPRAGERL